MEPTQSIFKERYGKTLSEQMKHLKAEWNKVSIEKLEKKLIKYRLQLEDADGEQSTDIQINLDSIREVLKEREAGAMLLKAITT